MAGSKAGGSLTAAKDGLSSYGFRDRGTLHKDTQTHHMSLPLCSGRLVFKARPTGRLNQAAGRTPDRPRTAPLLPSSPTQIRAQAPALPHGQKPSNDTG